MTNDEREALIDILTAKREHKISANPQGGYDCRCGARWDWQKSEKLTAERHAAGYLADAILAVFKQAYTPTDDEREVTEGALWGVMERLSLPLTGVEVQALAESVARRTAVQEPQDEPTDDERMRVEQSNDIAYTVIEVAQNKAPDEFVTLDFRYGIADALWDAGYRKSRRPVQAEPTDAQVQAFVTAINAVGVVLDRHTVKAGLRAAFQEGENRG